MNIGIIGSGGREHALAWKVKQSHLCDQLYIMPGNGGTHAIGTNIQVDILDFEQVQKIVEKYHIELLIIGPEVPLVEGIYDFFNQPDRLSHKVYVIGPSSKGAMLEGSKSFAKEFMQTHQIPTASYREYHQHNLAEGIAFIQSHEPPFVLKADGLAAGKGVLICQSMEEAVHELQEMISDAKFGSASATVLIEEFLDGIEFSVFVLTDGQQYVILPQAKDYKRIGEGNNGLNTGGMGAISPVPFVDTALMNTVKEQVIEPTIQGIKKEHITYKGFIYFGLILVNNTPYVIEYNCRLGDPETQVVLPRLENDLVELFMATHNGTLKNISIKETKQHAATVVMASGGYPEQYEKGKPISIPTSMDTSSIIFHAGTDTNNGNTITSGGRVLSVTSLEENIHKAVQKSNALAERIEFDKKYFRRDIGKDLERLYTL